MWNFQILKYLLLKAQTCKLWKRNLVQLDFIITKNFYSSKTSTKENEKTDLEEIFSLYTSVKGPIYSEYGKNSYNSLGWHVKKCTKIHYTKEMGNDYMRWCPIS